MAAGLGFKTFTTGEVLTAADTNGYLMQGVLVFASSAARAAAITSPQEGQYSYLKDTNSTEYYDGAAWIAAPIGDITGVTAGVGITGGGTSGTVTITNDMATTITASGDIVVGTGSGTYDNLPIGTTGQILTADTTVSPYKVKWATAASSGPANSSAVITNYESTTSTSYTALSTAGPAVTLTTGTKALVAVSSFLGNRASMSFDISGASSFSAADTKAVQENSDNSSIGSGVYLMTGLTAGSNTFTAKYRSTNGTSAPFQNRNIAVIDMGS